MVACRSYAEQLFRSVVCKTVSEFEARDGFCAALRLNILWSGVAIEHRFSLTKSPQAPDGQRLFLAQVTRDTRLLLAVRDEFFEVFEPCHEKPKRREFHNGRA